MNVYYSMRKEQMERAAQARKRAERLKPYTIEEMKTILWNETHQDVDARDVEKYVYNKCLNCISECETCKLRKLKEEFKLKLFEQYVYRNLSQFGNCYVSYLRLSKEQISDLSFYVDAKIDYKHMYEKNAKTKKKKCVGIIIYANKY